MFQIVVYFLLKGSSM